MELIQYDHQHYIRMSDFLTNAKLSEQQFRRKVESYTFDSKPLDCVEINGQPHLTCKSACHFLNWYLDSSYRALPDVNQFKHELTKFSKKIPKRVLSRSLRYELAYRQKYKCKHCNVLLPPDFEVDHIVALEDGGQDIASNLQCLCVPCHKNKTRLNRLRKHTVFASEAEAQHQAYMHVTAAVDVKTNVEEEAESSDEESMQQVFSKYFRTPKDT